MNNSRGGPKTSYLRFDPAQRLWLDQDISMRMGVDTWVVRGGVSFYVDDRKKEYWVHVPKGYSITGADIPVFFQRWINPTTDEGKAAIIHNYLCATGRVRIDGVQVVVDRREANRIFLQAMSIARVGFLKRWTLYLAASLSRGHLRPDGKRQKIFE